MRHIYKFVLLTLAVLSTCFCEAQKNNLSSYNSFFHDQLSGWTKTIRRFSLSSFKKIDTLHTIKFEDIQYMGIPEELKEFYAIYKTALTFSPDSTQFIDLYSYWLVLERKGSRIISHGAEVEQAVTLCNLKTKQWKRILFWGDIGRIQEIVWVTNTKFILVGAMQDGNDPKFRPIIYIGNVTTRSFDAFVSVDEGCYQYKYGYDSPKLLSLNIHEE